MPLLFKKKKKKKEKKTTSGTFFSVSLLFLFIGVLTGSVTGVCGCWSTVSLAMLRYGWALSFEESLLFLRAVSVVLELPVGELSTRM